jgi:hypothetical protein
MAVKAPEVDYSSQYIGENPFVNESTWIEKLAGCFEGPVDLSNIKSRERSFDNPETILEEIASAIGVTRQRVDQMIEKTFQKADFLFQSGYAVPVVHLACMFIEEFLNELIEAEDVAAFVGNYCTTFLKEDELYTLTVDDFELAFWEEVRILSETSFKEALELCEFLYFHISEDDPVPCGLLKHVVSSRTSARIRKLQVETGFNRPVGRPKQQKSVEPNDNP